MGVVLSDGFGATEVGPGAFVRVHGNSVNTPADGWSVIIHFNKGSRGISWAWAQSVLFYLYNGGTPLCPGISHFLFDLDDIFLNFCCNKISHAVKRF